MQSTSIWQYIALGGSHQYLARAQADAYPVHGTGHVLYNIDNFLLKLENFKLVVTRRAASDLIEFRDELAQKDLKENLTQHEAARLSQIMSDITITLRAEAQGNIAFIVTDKRLDVNKLL